MGGGRWTATVGRAAALARTAGLVDAVISNVHRERSVARLIQVWLSAEWLRIGVGLFSVRPAFVPSAHVTSDERLALISRLSVEWSADAQETQP